MTSRTVLLRLLTMVADAAEANVRLNHLAVVSAAHVLQKEFADPHSVEATKEGMILARWSDGRWLEIGPDWWRTRSTERTSLW